MIVRKVGALRVDGMLRLAAACCVSAALVPVAAHSEETIKIGVPVPLTGSYMHAGQDILNGAKLAVDRINKAGGVLGKQLEIVPADDQCDANMATQAAQKLADAGVAAVVGGYCSSAALPELAVFHRAGLPYVLDASTNPQLTDMGYKEVFRVIGRDDEQGPFVANFVAHKLHAKRAAVIDDGTTYATGLAETTVAALKKEGVDVVHAGAISPGQQDYGDTLKQVAELKPDVLFYTGYYPEAAVLVKQARQLGYKFTFMGGDGTTDPTLMQTASGAANGMYASTSPLPQFLPSARGFIDNYTKAYGHAPGLYSVYEYDAIGVTAKAIADGKSTRPADIALALHKASGYNGVTGDITFNDKGDRAKAVYMTVVVRNGAFSADSRLDANGHWVAVK
ncbi:branched-chain amino acid ABC transporter substrate-binding protein [Trinickia fusca]|uniref:Branched-chain amino acid ABC transporter substrate-binding protein n=2 Tax=Trinickia fusca TaxID=2419777 RepID=A0A494XP93_9BURK|nr:branched-chain amino acid ABC transporter substrate-binding protein [Trinickia fusca]